MQRLKINIAAVERGGVVVSTRLTVEVYPSEWLAIDQDEDCIIMEPPQLRELVRIAREQGWVIP